MILTVLKFRSNQFGRIVVYKKQRAGRKGKKSTIYSVDQNPEPGTREIIPRASFSG